MQMYEIVPYIQNLHLRTKENWEQARLNAYITAQVNSSKKLKITDIMEFPWEKSESKRQGKTDISNEDIERLKNKAKKWIAN